MTNTIALTIALTIPGEPIGKGRPIVPKNGHAFTPVKTRSYENLVKMEYQHQQKSFRFGDTAMLEVEINAYYSIPQSASKKKKEEMREGQIRPAKKPDCDNVAKIVLDALNKLAYRDDAQIVDCTIHKWYADDPRVTVIIREATVKNSKQ